MSSGWPTAAGTSVPGLWAMTTYFGPRFKSLFLAAFGAPVDPRRQWFYRLPYDLAS
jgi:hypothetical protein